MRLARVGYDNTIGYLEGGIEAWQAAKKDVDTVHRISADEFKNAWKQGETVVFDVRRDGEYSAEHVENAYHRSLSRINEWVGLIDKNEHFFMHCAGGYRSMMAASILKARGFDNFTEIAGGFAAIEKTGLPITDFICPSKLVV